MRTGMGAVAASLLSLTLMACQTTPAIEEAPATTELQPMEQPPTPNVGYTLVSLLDGNKDYRSEVVAHDADTVSWKSTTGCEWTVLESGFSPSVRWKNCGGSTGAHRVELTTESPWPLAVGKTWAFAFSGGDQRGSTWDDTQTCEVVGTASITAPIGTYDTFKVVCDSSWQRHTRYVSPELMAPLIYLRHSKYRNQTERYELIRIENNNRGS